MTLFTDKLKLANRAGQTKNPHQPEPVLVLNLAHQNLLSISDQGRGILEDTSRREAESGSVVKTAKKRGPQIRSVGFLFCPRGAVSAGYFTVKIWLQLVVQLGESLFRFCCHLCGFLIDGLIAERPKLIECLPYLCTISSMASFNLCRLTFNSILPFLFCLMVSANNGSC